MRENTPSRTAEYMALFRALEDARPPGMRLFADPFARAFLGSRLRAVVALAKAPGVAIDFDRDRIETALPTAGYDPNRLTLFLWEGVTNYLTAEAVDRTLRWCSSAVAPSRIVFTYVHRGVLDRPEDFFGTARVLAALEAAGERWTFGLDPSRLAAHLAERGYRLDEDVGAAEYRARCFGASASAMRGYEFYRIACASVAATSGPST